MKFLAKWALLALIVLIVIAGCGGMGYHNANDNLDDTTGIVTGTSTACCLSNGLPYDRKKSN